MVLALKVAPVALNLVAQVAGDEPGLMWRCGANGGSACSV